MANKGIPPDESKQEYPRQGMIKGFGDVSFSLRSGDRDGQVRLGDEQVRLAHHQADRVKVETIGRLNPIIETSAAPRARP